jgi:hypothetical protein
MVNSDELKITPVEGRADADRHGSFDCVGAGFAGAHFGQDDKL